jgi:hypothetical protein
MVQHSFCYSQIVVCCVDRLKPQPSAELTQLVNWQCPQERLAGRPVPERVFILVHDPAPAIGRKRWPNGVGYTTDRRPHNHDPDEPNVSLKSEPLKSGIL